MTLIGLGLGSNIGDKTLNITKALDALHAHDDITVTKASSFYKTPPWGIEDQDWFVNACALATTSLTPDKLLATIKHIEIQLGRVETKRWGPRLIDIDILFYGNESINFQHLTIPHKNISERAFVLIPLQEIMPDFQLEGISVDQLTSNCPDDTINITPVL